MVLGWPLEGAAAATPSGRTDARDTVRFFIRGRMAGRRGVTLLIFAGVSGELINDGDADLYQGQMPAWLKELDCQVVMTHSLGALLQVPQLKKAAWLALQPLVGMISA